MKNRIILSCFIMLALPGKAQTGSNSFKITEHSQPVKPSLFSDLGQSICTPDALAIDQNGELYLSVPNFTKYDQYGSKICRFTKTHEPVTWLDKLPADSASGKVYPMGMAFGADGNLYIADNQSPSGKLHRSRLIKVTVKNGQPQKTEIVVSGFNIANGVKAYKDRIYVTDSYLDVKGLQDQSGVYSFSLKELGQGAITLLPNSEDPHVLCRFTSKVFDNKHEQGGADGLTFDRDGNLYVGNFSDGVISKIQLSADGAFISQKIIVDSDQLRCCDGLCYDQKSNSIYIANFNNNSIHVMDLDKKELRVLWENDDSTGQNGELDQPCDPMIFKGKLVVVNFDSFTGKKNKEADALHTVSVFELKN